MLKNYKNKNLFSIILSFIISSTSYAQFTITNPEYKKKNKICTGLIFSYLKDKKIEISHTYAVKNFYEQNCLVSTWQQENWIDKINFSDKSISDNKKELLEIIPKMNEVSVSKVSENIYASIYPLYISTKGLIPEKELQASQEISYFLKKRIREISIPKEIIKIPQEQRKTIIVPFIRAFNISKVNFQKLDAILYPYDTSIKVLLLIDDANTREKIIKLNLNKEQCEIAHTYINTKEVDSCKYYH